MSAPATTIFTAMAALAERTGAVDLGQGSPDEDGTVVLLEAAVDALRAGHNQYAPLAGVPVLREAIAAHQQRRYGLTVDPDREVQVTFGATEGLAAALLALLRPGDEVLVLDPSYDSYAPIATRVGATMRPIPLDPPAWRITPEAVAAAITPRTRMLLLNSPHNPTGRVLDREELELLAGVCRDHDLVALTDEVYERLVYEGTHLPLATFPGMAERTLTVSSLAKTHGLTGWKVGWVTGPADLMAQVRGVKQFLSFAGGTPLQHAAAVGLGLPDAVVDEYAAGLRAKRDRLADGLAAAGFAVLLGQGTYFLNVDVAPLGEPDAEDLALRLPVEAGVVAIPVSALSADPARVASILRFACCKREPVLDEAVDRLSRWAAAR
jgi:N-succinyldiaminopimelate aminotransferase